MSVPHRLLVDVLCIYLSVSIQKSQKSTHLHYNLIVYYIYIHRYLYIITYYLYPLCAAAMLGGVVWTLSVAALLLLDPAHPRATQVSWSIFHISK